MATDDLSCQDMVIPPNEKIPAFTPHGMHFSDLNRAFAFIRATEHTPSKYITWMLVAADMMQQISFGLHPIHSWGPTMAFISNAVYLSHVPLWDTTSMFELPEAGRVALLWTYVAILLGCAASALFLYRTLSEVRSWCGVYKPVVHWVGTAMFIPIAQCFISFATYRHREGHEDSGADSLYFAAAFVGIVLLVAFAVVVCLFQYDINPRAPNKFSRSHSKCDQFALLHKLTSVIVMQVLTLRSLDSWLPLYIGFSNTLMGLVWAFHLPYYSDMVNRSKIYGLWMGALFAAVASVMNKVHTDRESDLDFPFCAAVCIIGSFVTLKLSTFRVSTHFNKRLYLLRYKNIQTFVNDNLPKGLSTTYTSIIPFNADDGTERGRKQATLGLPYIDTVYVATDVELANRFLRSFTLNFGVPPNTVMLDYATGIYLRGLATFPRSGHLQLCYAAYMFYARKRFHEANLMMDKMLAIDCSLVERYQAYKLSQMLKTDSTQLDHYKSAKSHHRDCLKRKVEFWSVLMPEEVDRAALDTCSQALSEQSESALSEYLHALRLEDKDKQIHKSDIRMIAHYGLFFDQVLINADLAERCFAVASDLIKSRELKALRGAKKAANDDGIDNIPSRDEVRLANDAGDLAKGSGRKSIQQAVRMLNVVFVMLLVLVSGFLVITLLLGSERKMVINSVAAVGRSHSAMMHGIALIRDITTTVDSPALTPEERAVKELLLPMTYSKLADLVKVMHANLNLVSVGPYTSGFASVQSLFDTPYIPVPRGGSGVLHRADQNLFGSATAHETVRTLCYRTLEIMHAVVVRGKDGITADDPDIGFLRDTSSIDVSMALNRSNQAHQEWSEEVTSISILLFAGLFTFGIVMSGLVFLGLVVKFDSVESTKKAIRHIVNIIPKDDVQQSAIEARAALEKYDQYHSRPEQLLSRGDLTQEVTEMSDPSGWDGGLLTTQQDQPAVLAAQEAADIAPVATSGGISEDMLEESRKNRRTSDGTEGSVQHPILALMVIVLGGVAMALMQTMFITDVTEAIERNHLADLIGETVEGIVSLRIDAIRFVQNPYDRASYDGFVKHATHLVYDKSLQDKFYSLNKDHLEEPITEHVRKFFTGMEELTFMCSVGMRLALEGAMRDEVLIGPPTYGRTPFNGTHSYEILRHVHWEGMHTPLHTTAHKFTREPPYKISATDFDINNPDVHPADLALSYLTSDYVINHAHDLREYMLHETVVIRIAVEDECRDKENQSEKCLILELLLTAVGIFLVADLVATSTRNEVLKHNGMRAFLLLMLATSVAMIGLEITMMHHGNGVNDIASKVGKCKVIYTELQAYGSEMLEMANAYAKNGDTARQIAYQTAKRNFLEDVEKVRDLAFASGVSVEGEWDLLNRSISLLDIAVACTMLAFNTSEDVLLGDPLSKTWSEADYMLFKSSDRFSYTQLTYHFTNREVDAQRGPYVLQKIAESLTQERFVQESIKNKIHALLDTEAELSECSPDAKATYDTIYNLHMARVIVGSVWCVLAFALLLCIFLKSSRSDDGSHDRAGDHHHQKKPGNGRNPEKGLSGYIKSTSAALFFVVLLLTAIYIVCFVAVSNADTGSQRIASASAREWVSAKSMFIAYEMEVALKSMDHHYGDRDPDGLLSFMKLQEDMKGAVQDLVKVQHELYFYRTEDGKSGYNGVGAQKAQDSLLFGLGAQIPSRYGGQCPSTMGASTSAELKYGLNSMVERWIVMQHELVAVDLRKDDIAAPLAVLKRMEEVFPVLMDALSYSTSMYLEDGLKDINDAVSLVLIAVLVAAVLIFLDFFAVFRPIMESLLVDDRTTKQILRLIPSAMSDLTNISIEETDKSGSRDSQISDEVMQMSPFPLISIDHNGIILKFSTRSVKEQFGFSALELAGANVNLLMPEEYSKNHEKYLANYRRTGIKKIIDKKRIVRAKRKNGKEFPCEVSVRTFKCAGEDVFLGYVRSLRQDIYLQNVTRRNTTIRDMNNDGVIVIDVIGTVITANPAVKAIFEFDDKTKDSTLVGQNIKVVMPHDIAAHHDEYLASYRQTRIKKMIGTIRRSRGQRRGGEVFPIEAKIEEVAIDPPVYVGYLRDISQNERLEDEQKTNDTIANLSMFAVVSIDDIGRILRFSVAAEKMFGCTETSLLGKNVKKLMPLSVASNHDEYLEKYRLYRVAHIVGSTRESQARKLDGTLFPVRIGVEEVDHPLKLTFVGFIEDLSEQRRIETQGKVISTVNMASPNGIITANPIGTIQSVNEEVLRLFKYRTKQDVIGKNLKMLMPKRYADKHDKFLSDYAQTGVKHVIDSSRGAEGLRSTGEEFPMTIKVGEVKTGKKTTYLGFVVSGEESLEIQRGQQVNQAALAVSTEAVVCINSFGLVLQFSRAATELWGYEEEEIVGQNVKILAPPGQAERHDEYLRAYVKTGVKHVIGTTREVATVNKQGMEELITARIAEVKGEGGSVFVALVNCKKQEQNLRRLSAYMEEIEKTMPLPMITIKVTGEIVSYNTNAGKTFGYSAAEVIGANVNILMEPDFRTKHDQILTKYRKSTKRDINRMRSPKRLAARAKDGTPLNVELSLSPVELYGKNTDCQDLVTGMLVDVSKLVELEESTKNVDKVTDLSATAVIVINFTGFILKFSKAAEMLFGRTADQAVGRNVSVLMNEPHASQHPQYLDNYKKYGVHHVIDTTIVTSARHASGKEIHIELTVVENKLKNSTVFIGFATDMSDTWRAQTLIKQNHTIQQLSCFPMLLIDTMGIIRSANKATLQTFGYEAEDIIGQNVKMLMPESVAQHHDGYLAKYRETGEKTVIGKTQYLRAQHADESHFSIELRVEEAPSDGAAMLMGCIRDLSQDEERERLVQTNRATVAYCAEPLIMINKHGIVDMFSKQACATFEYTPEEIIGQNIKTVMHPDIAVHHDGYLESYLQTGKKVMVDSRQHVEAFTKSGRSIHLVSMVKEAKINHEPYFFACLYDGSNGQALLVEQEVATQVVRWSSLPIIAIDRVGTILSINLAAEQMFLYSSSAILGKNVSLLMPNEVAEKHDGYLKKYCETRKATVVNNTVEIKGVTAEGQMLPVELSVREIVNDSGSVEKFIGYARSLTEVKNMEYTKSMTDTIIEQAPTTIILINARGIILRFSRAGESEFGYKSKAIVGKNVSLLMPEEMANRHDLFIKKYLSTGVKKVVGKTTSGLNAVRSNGKVFPIELTVQEVNKEGMEALFIGCLRDNTKMLKTQDLVMMGQAILSASILPLIVMTQTGIITGFSDSARAVFGWSADEVTNKNVKMLMPKHFSDQHDSYLKRYLDTGVKTVIDTTRLVQGLHRNGSVFDIELMVREIEVDGVLTYTGYCRDLTLPRNLEWEGKLSELLCHGFDEAIISIDSNSTVTRFNKAAEMLFQFTADQVLGRDVKILMTDDVAHMHEAYVEKALDTPPEETSRVRRRRVTGERKDGSHFQSTIHVITEELDDGSRGFTSRFTLD